MKVYIHTGKWNTLFVHYTANTLGLHSLHIHVCKMTTIPLISRCWRNNEHFLLTYWGLNKITGIWQTFSIVSSWNNFLMHSRNFVPKEQGSTLIQVMSFHRACGKPLPETTKAQFHTTMNIQFHDPFRYHQGPMNYYGLFSEFCVIHLRWRVNWALSMIKSSGLGNG